MAQATLHKTLQGHTYQVTSVAFSPDSKLIASASEDRTVRLWNVPNGNLNAELKGHENSVESVAFSPDGKSIVTGSADKTVRTWSIATKQQIKTLNNHSNIVMSVAWSPNGDVIASGDDNTVILWDAISGSVKKKLTGHKSFVMSVSFSQNGNKLASAGYNDNTAIIWDVNSGAALIKLAHSDIVDSVCFSHDDQFVVTGCGDGIVRMFNANNGREEKRFVGHTDRVESVACSFDGSTIVSGGGSIFGGDKSVRLWDVASTKQLQQLDEHTPYVRSVAFSRDGKFIASGSGDKNVRLWNAPSSLQHQILPKPVSARFCAALSNFAATEKGALSFEQNSILSIEGRDENGWAQAKLLPAGASGLIPLKYVEIISEAEAQLRLQQQEQIAAEIEKQKQEIEKQQKFAAEKQEIKEQKEELRKKKQEIDKQQKEFERQKAEQQKREQEIADRERKQHEELEKQKKQEEEAKKTKANLDPTQVAKWSVDDVCAYFTQAEIHDNVIAIFQQERVKGKFLADHAKDDILQNMGIKARGDRLDVIDAINKLVSPSISANTGLKLHEIPRRELTKDIKLNEGNFGIVWRGTFTGVPVAIKEPKLYGAELNPKKQLADLIEEATVMTSISVHLNVLHCYGLSRVGEEDYLLVTELCNLGSLDAFLRTYPGTPAVDRCRFSQQVARGLNHLCKHNVAHRDVAARNVLLHDQGSGVIVAKVCDFGLSRQREGEYYVLSGDHLLSPETAPEVFATGKHSSRSDVWSFGVLLWEVESLCATRARPDTQAFPPLSKRAQASDNIYEIMLKCWAKDPHQRPSFEALVDLLA